MSPSPMRIADRCSRLGSYANRLASRAGVREAGARAGARLDCPRRSCAKPRPPISAPLGHPATEGEYTWPGSNWRPSACWADVIATRPQVPDGLADPGHRRRKVKGFSTGDSPMAGSEGFAGRQLRL